MRTFTLAPLKVLGLDEVNTGASPLLGDRVCVIHVHVDGSAAHPLTIDPGSRKMDRQPVAMGEGIPLVMMRGTEAQLLVVGNRPRYIRDHEDRVDTNDAQHTEIIGAVAYLRLRTPRASGNIPDPAGESLPRDEPLRVGNGLDPLADLLRQLDDDSLRAADVAEPVAVLVALELADEFSAAGSQAGNDGVDVLDGE
jgi:hypothetical protein